MECITLDLTFWIKGRGKARFLISFAQNKIVKGNIALQFSQVGLKIGLSWANLIPSKL